MTAIGGFQGALAIVFFSLFGGAGCTSTVALAPEAFPDLAESTARYPKGWHEARGLQGEYVTLQGEVVGATVERTDESRLELAAPLRASIADEKLKVSGDGVEKVMPLSEVRMVEVTYTNERRGYIVGGVILTTLGAPALVGGASMIGVGFSEGRSLDTKGGLVGFLGVLTAANGIGMLIPGVMLLLKDSKDPRVTVGSTAPAGPSISLSAGAQGAVLSGRF